MKRASPRARRLTPSKRGYCRIQRGGPVSEHAREAVSPIEERRLAASLRLLVAASRELATSFDYAADARRGGPLDRARVRRRLRGGGRRGRDSHDARARRPRRRRRAGLRARRARQAARRDARVRREYGARSGQRARPLVGARAARRGVGGRRASVRARAPRRRHAAARAAAGAAAGGRPARVRRGVPARRAGSDRRRRLVRRVPAARRPHRVLDRGRRRPRAARGDRDGRSPSGVSRRRTQPQLARRWCSSARTRSSTCARTR